ncbi:MAG: hypothetical protein QOH16_723 [Gaiellaceae bacterium]|nr:hypothetical protein [Gaiellaceae bacterium]
MTLPTFLDQEERGQALIELFRDSHREAVPLRETFLQRRGDPPDPGPLSRLVSGGHHHALDLYLLIHAATATPPHQIAINSRFWTQLVARPDQSERSARRALERSLDTLEWLELIRPVTRLGVPVVELLDEYGWGDRYVHPANQGARYFTIPHAYWLAGFDQSLSLRAKAMLLIARSLKPHGFTLPLAKSQQWYGISPDTMRRGMKELVSAGLARYQANVVDAPKAPRSTAVRRVYILVGAVAR